MHCWHDDLPKVWEYNGAVYVMNVKTLRQMQVNQFEKVIKYEMDEMSSLRNNTHWIGKLPIHRTGNQLLECIVNSH